MNDMSCMRCAEMYLKSSSRGQQWVTQEREVYLYCWTRELDISYILGTSTPRHELHFEYISSSRGQRCVAQSKMIERRTRRDTRCSSVLQCVAVCCSVLQCAAVCCSVLQRVAVCCSVWQCAAVCAAVCCGVLRCAAVCCGVLQCVAVWLVAGSKQMARKTQENEH